MIDVRTTDDPAEVLREAGAFLLSRPVEHNVVLSILHSRLTHPEAGRYWWITDRGAVVAVGMQTPLTFSATVTPMGPELVHALVAVTDPPVPGIIGEAATAAAYAGAWAERHRVPVVPIDGERLFRLDRAMRVGQASGAMRPADRADRPLLVTWLDAFAADTGHSAGDTGVVVDRCLDEQSVSVWDDDGPVTMARAAPVVGGVARHRSGVHPTRATSTWVRDHVRRAPQPAHRGVRSRRDPLRAALEPHLERDLSAHRLRAGTRGLAVPLRSGRGQPVNRRSSR